MTKRYEDLHTIDLGSPGYGRAVHFTNMILAVMRDFIPQDRECHRRISDHLLRLAYEQNLQIVNVPPEWDALTKLEIERAMLETRFPTLPNPLL